MKRSTTTPKAGRLPAIKKFCLNCRAWAATCDRCHRLRTSSIQATAEFSCQWHRYAADKIIACRLKRDKKLMSIYINKILEG